MKHFFVLICFLIISCGEERRQAVYAEGSEIEADDELVFTANSSEVNSLKITIYDSYLKQVYKGNSTNYNSSLISYEGVESALTFLEYKMSLDLNFNYYNKAINIKCEKEDNHLVSLYLIGQNDKGVIGSYDFDSSKGMYVFEDNTYQAPDYEINEAYLEKEGISMKCKGYETSGAFYSYFNVTLLAHKLICNDFRFDLVNREFEGVVSVYKDNSSDSAILIFSKVGDINE